MINRECSSTSALLVNSNNWLSRTGQSSYILNEIGWFGFADYIKIDSL